MMVVAHRWQDASKAPETQKLVYVMLPDGVVARGRFRSRNGMAGKGWVDRMGMFMHPQPTHWSFTKGNPTQEEECFETSEPLVKRASNALDFHAIYIIHAKEMKPLKIGRSFDPALRLSTMQSGSPYVLRLFHVAFGDPFEIGRLEGAVHAELIDKGVHARGEWFDITPDEALGAVASVAEAAKIETWPIERMDRFCRGVEDEGASTIRNVVRRAKLLLDKSRL